MYTYNINVIPTTTTAGINNKELTDCKYDPMTRTKNKFYMPPSNFI